MDLPQQFLDNMKKILGGEYSEYEKSFSAPRLYGLRANTLKISPDELSGKGVFNLSPVEWCPEGFYYDENERPSKHPYYHAGLYYLQEPSAMAPGAFLPVNEGDKVLDLCAAPGGKTTHLGARLKNTGLLVSNDISAGRTKSLVKNTELFGLTNTVVTSETPKKLEKAFPEFFDKILVDAPCGGEGMFRKERDVIKSWNEELVSFCRREQREILKSAAKMLAPGGMMLYSTCTFSPLENEKTINDFLLENSGFEIVPIDGGFGFSDGRPDLIENGLPCLKHAKRLYPHKIKVEGHFLALLRKKRGAFLCGQKEDYAVGIFETKGPGVHATKYETENARRSHTDFEAGTCGGRIREFETEKTDKSISLFNDFAEKFLSEVPGGIYQIINGSLYVLPEGVPSLKGLRVMRSGLLLGELKKNRFEPSQALAMVLDKTKVNNYADFPLSDERVTRYLKGETVSCENVGDGYCLILCDGFPLGFAKAQSGRLKNRYPVSWKME